MAYVSRPKRMSAMWQMMMAVSCAFAASAVTACTQVYGSIPPSTFQFKTIVHHQGSKPGGWQVAQVLVLMHRLSPVMPAASVCDVEVGVPLVNYKGPVPTEFAQAQSAIAADGAARHVLKLKLPSGLLCIRFREGMEVGLDNYGRGPVPGARVRRFTETGVPRTQFPQ